ncbi:MAG: LysR family transcriptional regulator [Tissierellia bacterium]|nr:LysR family transcriptional regulator [Tissierellia bacterium]
MNDNDLKYIKTIAETKNISQAAKKLYISQPSLSRSLQRIEHDLGVILFNRTQNGMILTEAGELFYHCAINMLNILDNFKTDISFLNNLTTGKVRLGTTNFLGTAILPEIIYDYHRQYPDITLEIEEKSTKELEFLLCRGDLDLAVMHRTSLDSNRELHYEKISEDYFLLITPMDTDIPHSEETDPDGYPLVDLDDLKDEVFISYHSDKRMRAVVDEIFKEANFEPNVILRLRSYQTVKKLVSKGMGISFIPSAYSDFFNITHQVKKYRLKNVVGDKWSTTIVTNPDIYHSKAALEMIHVIKEFSQHNKTL